MVCEGFAYPKVMRFFEEISAIPRASYREEEIADYLEAFAKERRLTCYRDEKHNVLIDLPATAGREGDAPVLLQGHVDMVCEKNHGVTHDFSKDPLRLYVKDGWLRAEGTTLGADNGVAVALMLALLDGEASSHPALQCLFTVSEEVGMDGVLAFDYSRILARKMLNMDSADENGIIVGCMGGLRSRVTLPILREAYEAPVWRLTVSGLAGGHSGEDIHRGRANANKVMGRILSDLLTRDEGLRLISLNGGSKDNAIPREAEALVASSADALALWIGEIEEELRGELYRDDEGIRVSAERASASLAPMNAESTEKTVFLVSSVANGVFCERPEMAGAVEYSRNLGVLLTQDDAFMAIFSSRSARDSQIDQSARELSLYAKRLGGSAEHYNRYPGWLYSEHSPLREEYVAAYRRLYGGEPRIEIIHAGLECGVIKAAIPDMDLLSCGPVVVNLHSPDEALSLASFERFIALILQFLSGQA